MNTLLLTHNPLLHNEQHSILINHILLIRYFTDKQKKSCRQYHLLKVVNYIMQILIRVSGIPVVADSYLHIRNKCNKVTKGCTISMNLSGE